MINKNPTKTNAWKKLQIHYNNYMKHIHMNEIFSKDLYRFEKYSIQFNEIFVDYSKNIIVDETLDLLLELAKELDLKSAIESMFIGEEINQTENRAVLHTACRNLSNNPIKIDNKDIMLEIKSVLKKMEFFSEKIRNSEIKGFSGKTIDTLINIGIGGSDLGPCMVTEALKFYSNNKIKLFFVSNIDGSHIYETLKKIDPETSLFIISSKTFTTFETLTNANTAKNWFLESAKNKDYISKHFIAVTTNIDEAVNFGINKENIFIFWDFICGRFSLWSAIGLSISCYIGFDNFKKLLRGAHEMDLHFRNEALNKNIPIILALIGIWYNNFFKTETEAIFPYDQYLHKFPDYFQQCNMESNGKYIDRDKLELNYQTGPIIWGGTGTNGQHAFFQLIHQGTKIIPADFLVPIEPLNNIYDHHKILLSNFFAQTEALMTGICKEDALKEMQKKGFDNETIQKILPYNIFKGNRPSNSILYKKLTPENLGSLIAMYEHKIFVQGYIWNIYSFDQWGVELGKKLALKILPKIQNYDNNLNLHPSTNALINKYKSMKQDS